MPTIVDQNKSRKTNLNNLKKLKQTLQGCHFVKLWPMWISCHRIDILRNIADDKTAFSSSADRREPAHGKIYIQSHPSSAGHKSPQKSQNGDKAPTS